MASLLAEFLPADTIIQVHLIVVSIAIPLLVTWIRSKTRCLDKMDKRTLRIAKAFLLYAQRQDQITQSNHPEESKLSEQIELLLRDEKGNL